MNESIETPFFDVVSENKATDEVELPYFDVVLEDKETEKVLLDHSLDMHWGYWEDPSRAFSSEENNIKAATENLSRLIYSGVDIKEGYKLADVGCGFGGTIDLINKNFSGIDMVGLNIDPRQIEVAGKRVRAVNDNKIEFITGDACNLPFEDRSIDSLIAVECIFHFPDREKFFSEVSRVLKPGGKFCFSDFVPAKEESQFLSVLREKIVGKHYGGTSKTMTLKQYNEVAELYGMKNICALDINKNVLPTYKAIYYFIDSNKKAITFHKKIPTRILELTQRLKRVLYMVIGYQKRI